MSTCIFCRIASGEVPARVAYQDDSAVAFHDLSPQAPIHVLVIPKKHIRDLGTAETEDSALLGHLLDVTRKLADDLELNSGFRVVLNVGRHAGQSVDHLHIHLLGGRPMTWPPG